MLSPASLLSLADETLRLIATHLANENRAVRPKLDLKFDFAQTSEDDDEIQYRWDPQAPNPRADDEHSVDEAYANDILAFRAVCKTVRHAVPLTRVGCTVRITRLRRP